MFELDRQPRARRPKLAFDGGQRDIQRLIQLDDGLDG